MKKILAVGISAIMAFGLCAFAGCGGETQELQTIHYENGSVYEGQVTDGKANGEGILTDADGNVWKGEFVDDLLQGYGTYTGVDFVEYTGEFKDSQFHGLGNIVYANGDEYWGQFENGQKIGVGKMIFADSGCVYEGDWTEDNMSGMGWMTWPVGDVYWGSWRGGNPQGFGCKVFYDANFSVRGDYLTYNIYAGRMLNNLMDGWGLMYYAESGGVYVGEWVNGVRDDTNGTYYFENGAEWLKFVGTFSASENNGWIWGEGTMYYADGRVVEGVFHGTDLVEETSVTYTAPEETDPVSVLMENPLAAYVLGQL